MYGVISVLSPYPAIKFTPTTSIGVNQQSTVATARHEYEQSKEPVHIVEVERRIS